MKSNMSNEDVLEEMSKVEPSHESQLEAYLISHPEFIQKWLEEKVSPETLHKLLNSPRHHHHKVQVGRNCMGAAENCTTNNHSPSSQQRKKGGIVEDEAEGDEDEGDSGPRAPPPQSAQQIPFHHHHGLTDEEVSAMMQRAQSRSKRNSITSDRFQSWLSSSALTTSPKQVRPMGGGGGGDQLESTNLTSGEESSSSGSDKGDGQPRGDSNIGNDREHSEPPAPTTLKGSSRLSQLVNLDENELFIELVKDISNELNIDILCHKILVNVGFLTQGDRCSLFLARGPQEQRYLIAKLFDVTIESEVEESLSRAQSEEIRIPFGVGIAGHVALLKTVVNIKDAYKDPRFSKEVDSRTGYKTCSILALPICNNEGDVIGVAQVINKKSGDNHFTSSDIEVFQRYLTFCGIGIQNAQLFETSVAEYRKNQLLLNLARSIFEEQTSLERLVSKIMREAQELLKCERSLVYLRDVPLYEASQIEKILMMPSTIPAKGDRKPLCRRESKTVTMREVLREKGVLFELVFELTSEDTNHELRRPSPSEIQNSPLTQIAKYVATNSEILNIGDAIRWYSESGGGSSSSQELVRVPDPHNVPYTESLPKSILCMPIYNGQRQVIGVAQLINKTNNQPFTDSDANTFEAFAIFCGLGIHNTQLYEGACKLMAKQSVALECLSYHATASPEDTERLRRDEIPSATHYNLFSYVFNDFPLTDSETCKATIRMFLELNLVSQFHIPYKVLCRWVLSVKKNYRPVKYHNWRHAFNVAQTMFTVLKTGKMEQFLDDRDILGLMVACLCHDLDHRGTNNAFQQLTASPLAVLYSTSTMEHHHFDQCVMILSSEGNNIFQDLSAENYRRVMKIVERSILSTDLAMYFRKKDRFIELIENGEIAWQGDDKKDLLCGMMMTACDVAAISKPWEIQHKIAKLVADEFFDQGDLEKEQLNQQPVAMMDREKKDELPKMQLSFIDVICLPLYKTLSETFPWLKPLLSGCLANRHNWQDLAEKVDMGLTWIDHDVIENPVEEFSRDSEPQDVNFVVTTLNCSNTTAAGESDRSYDSDIARRSRSKWKLRKLWRESGGGGGHIHKSVSSQSKTPSDTSSTPVLIQHTPQKSVFDEPDTSSLEPSGTGPLHHTNKFNFEEHSNVTSGSTTGSTGTASASHPTNKQKCTIS